MGEKLRMVFEENCPNQKIERLAQFSLNGSTITLIKKRVLTRQNLETLRD